MNNRLFCFILFYLLFATNGWSGEINKCNSFTLSKKHVGTQGFFTEKSWKDVEDTLGYMLNENRSETTTLIEADSKGRKIIGSLYQLAASPMYGQPLSVAKFVKAFDTAIKQSILDYNSAHPDQPLDINLASVGIGFPFKSSVSGEVLILRYGETVPEGFFYDSTNYPNGEILYNALGNLGLFPLSMRPEYKLHDTFHLSSYIENPLYALHYRRIAKKVSDGGGWKYLKENLKRAIRITYFNESLTLIYREKLQELFAYFSQASTSTLPEAFRGIDKEYEKNIMTRLRDKEDSFEVKDLLSNFDSLLANSSDAFKRIGGAARDGVNQINQYDLQNGIVKFAKKFVDGRRLDLEGLTSDNMISPDNIKKVQELVQFVSQFQALLTVLANVNEATWAEDIMMEKIPEDSQVRHFYELIEKIGFDLGIMPWDAYSNLTILESHLN